MPPVPLAFIGGPANTPTPTPTITPTPSPTPSPTPATNFASIFGSATSFNIQTADAWCAAGGTTYSTYSSLYGANADAFWSYMSTSSTAPGGGTSSFFTGDQVPVADQTSTLSSPIVDGIYTGSYNGYNVSQSIIWSSTNDGVWMSSQTDTAVISVNISSGNFNNAKYFIARSWTTGFHQPFVIKITANGISRLFALQSIVSRNNGNLQWTGYYAPLVSTITSFTDNTLVFGGSTISSSYFQWI